MSGHHALPHLPGRALIEAYGNGGFRFSTMSHRGSLLCLPSGIYAWDASTLEDVSRSSLAPVFAERGLELSILVLGTGATMLRPGDRLRYMFNGSGISLDAMATGAAARTYNIMLGEGRPVAAALLAVP